MPPRIPIFRPWSRSIPRIRSSRFSTSPAVSLPIVYDKTSTAYSAHRPPRASELASWPFPRTKKTTRPQIKVYKAPPSTLHLVPNKDAVAHLDRVQIAKLDPTGARTALFSQSSPDAIKAGDVLVVRQRNSDSFAGVCLSIRRRGVDTAILLRNQLTRVGVEMWFKIYSPNVEGIELVQRRAKRARRARLYYMRKPKHDMGSVQNIVREHSRQNSALSTSDLGRGSRPGKRTKTGSKKTM